MTDDDAILTTDSITKSFGALVAVDGVSIRVDEGEIVGLIGPNGSGKTTLLNVITGELTPDSGRVQFAGKEITGLEPSEICRRGVSKTAQIPRPLSDMSVLDNVVVASLYGTNQEVTVGEARVDAREWLEFVGIPEMADTSAGGLTHTGGRRLELARALATRPDVLLLDEVMAGLTSEEIDKFQTLIERMQANLSVSILWVEHLVEVITETATRIVVLDMGEKIADGPPEQVMTNREVQKSYLGGA